MDMDLRAQEEEEIGEMPSMSPHDPLTYDPTQGAGTSAWQLSVKASMEANANERRN